jgi:hypothetical protein
MELEGIIISAGVTIFSVGLMIVSLASYKKYRNSKLLFISCVFIVLFIKGILFSLSIFFPEISILHTILYSIYSGLFDLIILILLFVATLKR